MSKSATVARLIQGLIHDRKLKPGDAMPSERAIAEQLGFAYTTVRLANDMLARQGVIDRQHGRGTFVAPQNDVDLKRKPNRIGLLYVDMHDQESPSLRDVTFQAQRGAAEAGCQLVIEPMETDELLHGREPEMLAGRSVDGVLLYGRVRDHHVRYVRQSSTPFIVLGNRPIAPSEPQARIGFAEMAYQITRELLKAGRFPVWYDVDVNSRQYHAGQEQLEGYANACHEFGDGSLHICSLRMQHMVESVHRLWRGGLEHAAIVAQDWAASLMPAAMSLCTDQWQRLLVVPAPTSPLGRMEGPNVVRWVGDTDAARYARLGVRSLLDALEGKTTEVQSVTLQTEVRLQSLEPEPVMELQLAAKYENPSLRRASNIEVTNPPPARKPRQLPPEQAIPSRSSIKQESLP